MSVFEIFRDNKKKEYSETDAVEHYRRMSIRCSVLKWLSLIVLVVFVVVSVSMNGDALSFDSIRYIVRYMVDEPVTLVSSGDKVSYDYNSHNNVYLIGDDFAIIGSDGISIYDFSGKILFTDDFSYSNPCAVSYDKELIVYDVGGNEIRFYNSYTMLNRLTFESPVYSIRMSEEGNYVVNTASEGYCSGFRVYDINKELIFRHNFGELTLQAVDISPDGKFISTASFSSLSNIVTSSLSIYDIKKDTPVSQITFDGEYPVDIEYASRESIVLFTNKSIKIYDSNLNLIYTEYYGSRSPDKFKISDGKIIFSYTESLLNEKTTVCLIDFSGNKINFISPSSVSDFVLDDNLLHILCNNEINTYSLESQEYIGTHNLSKPFSKIVKKDKNSFLLSRSDEMQIFIYEK